MTPVLKDLLGQDFTVGDRIVYAATTGIRTGKVEWIKESISQYGGETYYKVFIELSSHHNLKQGQGKMFAKKVGYEYVSKHFLKV